MFHLKVRQGTGDKGFITYEGVIASAESNFSVFVIHSSAIALRNVICEYHVARKFNLSVCIIGCI